MFLFVIIITVVVAALVYALIIKQKKTKYVSEAMKRQTACPSSVNNSVNKPIPFPNDYTKFLEAKGAMEQTYDKVRYDYRSYTLFCKEAPFLMIHGELIEYEEITHISVDSWTGYYKDGDLVADADDGDYVVIYGDDYDYTETNYDVVVNYVREGQERRIQVTLDCFWAKEIESYKS